MKHDSLPIHSVKNQILKILNDKQILVLGGATGSGKSTGLPIILYNNFLKNGQNIVITQPRRVAAISLCRYVSSLLNCEVGTTVGFNVRFLNKTTEFTRIKYLTDGILIREATADPLFRKYSIIIIDEVHERSIRTDILLGILKLALPKRADLKLVIMSATLESTAFSKFFSNSSVINVPGKTFPLEIFYTPTPFEDYIEASMITIFKLNLTTVTGDILVFLPGQDDIEILERLLKDKLKFFHQSLNSVDDKKNVVLKMGDSEFKIVNWKHLEILVLYSSLSVEKQYRVFKPTPPKSRKVILSTNIAETSLTIPGIKYVIDTGLVKQRRFNPKSNLESLTLTVTSKASANQRAGRAGREGPGKIYRLYTKQSYDEMSRFTTPEIHLVDFSFVFLELKIMGVKDILEFPFVEMPEKNTILSAALNLYRLGAMDSGGNLTETGRMMAKIPLLPLLSKFLITSFEFGCTSEVLTIVSMLSSEISLFDSEKFNPEGVKMRTNLYNKYGDHLTLLNLYQLWENANSKEKFSKQFAINNNAFNRTLDIRNQLAQILKASPFNVVNISKCGDSENWDKVRMCLTKANWINSAIFCPETKSYSTLVKKQQVFIHPSSVLFNKPTFPSHVVYNDCIFTKKNYIQNITEISENWLTSFVPKTFKGMSKHT